LRLLREGVAPAEAVAQLIASDPGGAHRQLHVLDAKGQSARHTGTACIDWCGHLGEADLSVAGNMLTGPDVLEETLKTFEARADLPFPRRLIAALRASEAAGGDRRGKQSACLVIVHDQDPHLNSPPQLEAGGGKRPLCRPTRARPGRRAPPSPGG
jgi:uncharacterized Ntn-hydrolase superfamily protein